MSSSDSVLTTEESEFFLGRPTGRPTGFLILETLPYNINIAKKLTNTVNMDIFAWG